MTICPGELMLATPTTSPCAASAQTCSTAASVHAQQRGHRAGAHRHRLLHELAAAPHQAHRVREAQRARDHERGVLAQAVARRRGRGSRPARRARRRRPRWRSAPRAGCWRSGPGRRSGPSKQSAREGEAERVVGFVPDRARRRASARRGRGPSRPPASPGRGRGRRVGAALPSQQRRAPGEAAAEGGHQHEIAGLDPAGRSTPPRGPRRPRPRRCCRSAPR